MTSTTPSNNPPEDASWLETASDAYDAGTPLLDPSAREMLGEFRRLSAALEHIEPGPTMQPPSAVLDAAMRAWEDEVGQGKKVGHGESAIEPGRMEPQTGDRATTKPIYRRVSSWLSAAAAVMVLGLTASYVINQQKGRQSFDAAARSTDTAEVATDADVELDGVAKTVQSSAAEEAFAPGDGAPAVQTPLVSDNADHPTSPEDRASTSGSDTSGYSNSSTGVGTEAGAEQSGPLWIVCASDRRPLWQCFSER